MKTHNERLLIVDDEDSIRDVLTDFLTMEGYSVVSASNGIDAQKILETESFHCILLDLKMPGMSGLELLEIINTLAPESVAIMMTGFGTVETAIKAMKSGAYDYILKPFKVQEVINLIERGLKEKRLEQDNIQLREAVELYDLSEELSSSLEMNVIYDLLIDTTRAQIDADGVALWIRGEDDNEEVCERRWMRGTLEASHARQMLAIDVGKIQKRFIGDESLIIHGDDARELIQDEDAQTLSSLFLVPLKNSDKALGFLVAFAFDENEKFLEGKRKMLTVLAGRASAAIENAALYSNLKTTFKQTIQAFANLLEDKDPYTHGHSHRVKKYAVMIAVGMGMSDEEVELISDTALMHDIGKLGIRYEDLNKAEPLTEGEYEMFKSHTTRGKWILQPIPFLHGLIPGVYHHHERWDGRGYPVGLKGTDIPLAGRILAVADTYDAMTSHRAYRRALPHDVAISEITAYSGTQFDPEIVKVFLREIKMDAKAQKAKAQRWQTMVNETANEESKLPFGK